MWNRYTCILPPVFTASGEKNLCIFSSDLTSINGWEGPWRYIKCHCLRICNIEEQHANYDLYFSRQRQPMFFSINAEILSAILTAHLLPWVLLLKRMVRIENTMRTKWTPIEQEVHINCFWTVLLCILSTGSLRGSRKEREPCWWHHLFRRKFWMTRMNRNVSWLTFVQWCSGSESTDDFWWIRNECHCTVK